jgi:hypothetical protein
MFKNRPGVRLRQRREKRLVERVIEILEQGREPSSNKHRLVTGTYQRFQLLTTSKSALSNIAAQPGYRNVYAARFPAEAA